jgi:hypothetical protein
LGPGRTIGDVLADDASRRAIAKWLDSQPVTDVRFKQDLHVELTVAAPPDDLLRTILQSARQTPGASVPDDENEIEQLRRQFARRVSAAIGRASVVQQPAATDQVTIGLPPASPDWVGQPLDAEGVADSVGSKLRTKTAAEGKATDALRARINELPLGGGRSIEDMCKENPRIAGVVENALLRARVYSVEYRDDGSVRVRLMLNSRDLWDDLRQATAQ